MLSKISCAIALIAGAHAIETESEQRFGGRNSYQQERPSYGRGDHLRPSRPSTSHHDAPRGYGQEHKRAAPKASYAPSPYSAAP